MLEVDGALGHFSTTCMCRVEAASQSNKKYTLSFPDERELKSKRRRILQEPD
jgi:hypothetical protein